MELCSQISLQMDEERYKLFPKLGVILRTGHIKGTDSNKCNQSETTTKNRYILTKSSVQDS